MLKLIAPAIIALVIVAPAMAQSVTVKGVDGSSHELTKAALAALPRENVSISDHGKQVGFTGTPLRAIATLAGAPEGEAIKGPALSMVLVITASDGYRVVLSLAEIDPSLGGRHAILADASDGRPLDAHQGPFRLVVEGDMRPARSARNVAQITLRMVD